MVRRRDRFCGRPVGGFARGQPYARAGDRVVAHDCAAGRGLADGSEVGELEACTLKRAVQTAEMLVMVSLGA